MLPQVNIIRAKHGDFLSFYERAGISGVLTAHGVWDELTITLAKALIDRTAIKPTIIDVGANMGTFAIPISRHIEKLDGVVYAFEPQRIIYYQICGNIFLNRIENIFCHNIALSNNDHITEVRPLNYVESWNIGGYSLSENSESPQPLREEAERITFKKMDDIYLASPPTLIKIDVEGMELEVLEGGLNLIRNSNFPPILFEYNEGDRNGPIVLELLMGLGYGIKKYADSDYLAQHPAFVSGIMI